ncbi:MAG: type II toxin-antitoxin system death-on-curing family toxin [Candidatus Hydrogenedentes bacterium]|nr:type II toxin-antitoxin system death-on-curing family toxin [Candidatus Hydrogenedentota bacterium]
MRLLTLREVLFLHRRIIQQSGGTEGILHASALESAVAQPRMTFGGEDLYPGIHEKAAALCHAIVANHPFLDGNKRTGHAAMATFLHLNGFTIESTDDEQERLMLALAVGRVSRQSLAEWIESHMHRRFRLD